MCRGLTQEKDSWEELGGESCGQRPVSAVVQTWNGFGVFGEEKEGLCVEQREVEEEGQKWPKMRQLVVRRLGVPVSAVGLCGRFQAREWIWTVERLL